MSVKKDKTLLKVRTFAQDFKDHAPDGQPVPTVTPTVNTPEIKKPSVVIQKTTPRKSPDSIKTLAESNETEIKEQTETIPVFNELQNELTKAAALEIGTTKPPRQSVIVKKRSVPAQRQRYIQEATVITAKKKSEGRATKQSLLHSLSSWIGEIRKQSQKKKAPTYVVGGADRRKGVIKKATTKSGAIFTADNETLQEEILRRRSVVKHDTQVTWSPNTDVGYDLLEPPGGVPVARTQNVEVTYKQRAIPEPTIIEPNSSWKYQIPEDPPPEPVPLSEFPQPVMETAVPAPTETTPLPVEPESIYPPEPVVAYRDETIAQPAFGSALIPNVGPYDDREPSPLISMEDIEPLFRGEFSKLSTNIIALLAVSVIALSALAIIAAQGLYNWMQQDSTTTVLEPATALATDGTATDVLLQDTTSLGLRTAISQSDALATAPIQEFRFLGNQTSALTPQSIISLLDFETQPNFNQTVTALHFLIVDNVQHAIVMRVSNPITALGSLYNWEQYMQEDLGSLLNSKNVPPEATTFADDTINGKDVRILTDGVDEVLVYGFISENVLLITKSSESFARIVSQ